MNHHPHLPFTRKARTALGIVVAALLVVLLAIYAFIPPVREFASGPSADAVAAQRNLARAEDLAVQNETLEQKFLDTSADKSKEIADLTAALADNKAQLAEANAKLSAPDENAAKAAQAAVSQARAESLKKQYDALQADADRKLAARSADAASAQARAEDLKKQIDTLQYVPPVTTSVTKQQIIDSTKVLGAYTEQSPFNYARFDQLEINLNRDMQVSGSFTDWTQEFRPELLTEPWMRSQIPLVTWEPMATGQGTEQPEFSLPKIINGDWDEYITRWALAAKATDLPYIMRWAQEMQLLNAYPWAEGENGNPSGSYAEAYRHIWQIFENVGANENVVWMFTPNRVNRIPNRPQPAAYYPGSKYADILAFDAYFRNTDLETDRTFDDTFGPTLALLKALDPSKPVWVAETGATDKDGYKAAWVRSLFEELAKPETGIDGLMMFSLTIVSQQGSQVWSFDTTPAVTKAAQDGLTASGFGRLRGSDTPPPSRAAYRSTSVGPSVPPTPIAPVYYKNCDAVRAALAAPLYSNQAGYTLDLDGNADGVACED